MTRRRTGPTQLVLRALVVVVFAIALPAGACADDGEGLPDTGGTGDPDVT